MAVVCEGTHLCMSMRGVEKQNSFAVTSAMLGVFRDNARTRMEFLELIRGRAGGAWRCRSCRASRASPIEGGISVRIAAVLMVVALAGQVLISAQTTQTKRPPARRPAVPLKIEEAMVNCPTCSGRERKPGGCFAMS